MSFCICNVECNHLCCCFCVRVNKQVTRVILLDWHSSILSWMWAYRLLHHVLYSSLSSY
jgi:hypothetical protein